MPQTKHAAKRSRRAPARRPRRAAVSRPAPPLLDTASLPGPDDIVRRELANGIVALVRENFTSPAVVVDGMLHAGSLYEPRDASQAGLAAFTARCLMRGTERYTFAQMYEDIEAAGARLSISGGTHTAGFGGKGLAEDLGLLLDRLAEALRHPTFPAEHVEKVRGEILTGLAIREHDTRSMASLTFDELAYAGHPYAVSEEGYPDTVRAITRDDLAAFHRKTYGPRGMIVVIVGAVKAEAAVALVEKYLGEWRNPEQPARAELPALPSLAEVREKRVTIAGKTQSDIVLGLPGPARSAPDFLDARLGNSILGVFGMMGRIGDQVREKAGMAYYAYSQLDGGFGPGPWSVTAGVHPQNVERAVELIRAEIRKFASRRVTAQELADNQAFFIGRLPLQLETNEGVAGLLSQIEAHNLGLDYARRYPALISAITRDSVLAAAHKYLDPDRYALAIAGPH